MGYVKRCNNQRASTAEKGMEDKTEQSLCRQFHDCGATLSSFVFSDSDSSMVGQNPNSLLLMAETSGGYSLASYYTSLGLFVISVPGLWSLIKRSVKSKIVRKMSVVNEIKKEPKQVAGEILSFFTRKNFNITDRGETITLASVGLVLTITVPDFGNNWFFITLLSPLAGVYYWKKASRKEEIKVKMMVGEEGKLSEIVVQGDDVQLSEKGMVYVKGLFERSS